MRPIKVCFVSLYAYHFFNPANKSRFGGAELQLYLLAKELSKDSRFEVSFIVGNFGQPDMEVREGIALYKFSVSTKGIKYTKTFLAILKLWKLLYKISPDVCIQRAAGVETGLVALFCKVLGRNFIYMVAHDSDLNPNRPKWMAGLRGAIRWYMFRVGLRVAKIIYVQHSRQKEELYKHYHKHGLTRASAHYILSVIDATKKNTILWVARCEDWKQPEVYIKLAQKFPHEKFIMVMPEANDPEFYLQITNNIKQVPNLHHIDFVPIDKIDSYFMSAKIFVNTSAQEGFPNTFIQAAKTKTPIVSLSIDPDGMLEKFDIGVCGHGNFEKLKAGLEKLLSDESLRSQMGESGYKYAKQNHDLKKIVEQDKDLIFRLVRTKF